MQRPANIYVVVMIIAEVLVSMIIVSAITGANFVRAFITVLALRFIAATLYVLFKKLTS